MEEDLKLFPLPLANPKFPRKKIFELLWKVIELHKLHNCRFVVSLFFLLPHPHIFSIGQIEGRIHVLGVLLEAQTWENERSIRV